MYSVFCKGDAFYLEDGFMYEPLSENHYTASENVSSYAAKNLYILECPDTP